MDFYIFKGADGSMGFNKDQVYQLSLTEDRKGEVVAKQVGGNLFCPYSNYTKFYENWTKIIFK